MIAVSVCKKLSNREWLEMQCWSADNFSSYIDSHLGIDHNNNYYFDFVFADEGEAAWFKLKWAV